MFHELTRCACRQLVFEYAKSTGKKFSSNWEKNQKAGKYWFYGFVKRQQVLALRLPEATSLARSHAFNKTNVEIFFNNLQVALERHAYLPHSIWFLDETGITTVQKSPRIVAEKGAKQIGQVTSHERGVLVTMCCCANSVG